MKIENINEIYNELKKCYEILGIYGDLYVYEGTIQYNYTDEFEIMSGATKLVIPIADKVYKISYTKEKFYLDEYNEETDECEEQEREEESEYNYCEMEFETYNSAIQEGVAEAFAEIKYFDNVEGLDVYVAEKAEPFWFSDEPIDEETSKTISESNLSYEMSKELWTNFVEYYGIDFCKKLSDFIEENNINDLCGRNCGRINGRPVFIDYSGYFTTY